MNSNFFKILSFALPYKKEIFLSIIFNILVVIFSLGSITILVPVLKIMFGTSNKIMQQPVFTGFFKIRDYLDALINYKIYHNIQTYGNAQVLGFVMAVACLMFVLKNFFRYNALVNLGYLKNYIENDIRNALHAKIVSLPISFFSEKRKGDLMARLTTDISEIQWGVLGAVQKGVQDPLMILSTFVMLLIFSPKLTMLVLVLIPLAGVIISRIGSALKKPSFAARNEYSKLMTLIDEHISGLAVIKSYTAEDDVKKRFEENGNKYLYHLNQINRRKELSSPVSETLGSFVIIFVVWYGSYLIMAKNSLQPEMFITYILLLYQIITPAKSLSTAFYDIRKGGASAERINELLETPNNMLDATNAINKVDFEKNIVFKNVSFKYHEDEKYILKNFDLEIKKGTSVALVGASGSGKTTIANLVNRFYDVNEGEILLDGIPYKEIKQKSLRKQIGYITQEPFLFNDTIYNNIVFSMKQASEEDVINAAKIANAHEFIMNTENGYQTIVGDRGIKLSGGQRQRITIARAMLKNPPILVLDEATSALDSESEKLVQNALTQLMKSRTSIIIAHRLSTIQHADKIIVMKEGKIVEQGNHEHLMSFNGDYKRLVELQSVTKPISS